ncbi:hypothetical protein GCM10023148_08810 [Actinokineospora soli]
MGELIDESRRPALQSPPPHPRVSRRTVLRAGGSSIAASALVLGAGKLASAAPSPGALESTPYYTYTPNIKIEASPFPDIACGKPVTSNSFTFGANTPYNGNDGFPHTHWSAADASAGMWWKVDLQGYYDLRGTRVVWPENRGEYAYRIDVSTDGTAWRTAVDRVDNTLATRVRTDDFTALDVRFVRVTITPAGGVPAGFTDFRVFGEPRPGSDVALGKIAHASAGGLAARAVDGSDSTSWDAEGLYWRVDLRARFDVTAIEVTWAESAVLYHYAIEVSPDGTTWRTAVDRSTGARGGVQSNAVSEREVNYVRLRMVGVDDGHQADLMQVKVFGTYSPTTDVALGRSASATSGAQPANANDGKPATLWIAGDGNPHSWTVDLGAPHDLNTVRTSWESASAAYKFTVEASADKQTWTRIVDRSANTSTAQPYVDPVAATDVRYVRVNFLSADGWWAGLRSCEVLGVPSEDDQVTRDVAVGKPTYTNDPRAHGTSGNATDADAATFFRFLDYGTPYTYTVDLLGQHDLSAVEIAWQRFGTRNPFQVQVSMDHIAWSTVAQATAQPVSRTALSAKRIRFVRLVIPSTFDSYASAIKQFKVFGTRSPVRDLALGRPLRTANDTTNRWWTVDFPGLTQIENVQIVWKDAKLANAFTVEISSDGVVWVKGATSSGEPVARRGEPYQVRAGNVRFVRIVAPTTRTPSKDAVVTALRVTGRYTTDESVLELEQKRSFQYFWDMANTDPASGAYGLIAESTEKPTGSTSTSGTGFGLAALAVGVDRGWVPFADAYQRALGTLRTLLRLEHVRGVFFHYYSRTDGSVWHWPDTGKSEVGLIDTQLLLNGVIVAGEYFGGEVKALADEIYLRVDWDFFREPVSNHFHMSYFTDTQEFKYFWNWSAEGKVMYVLGAGSPTHPVDPSMFYSFHRQTGTYGEYPRLINTWFGSLFTYQFAETVVDFRNSQDGRGVDWWYNSVLATRTNRQHAIDEQERFRTFGPDSWGMTACGSPTGYNSALGAPPSGIDNRQHQNDGTLSPDGAVGAVPMDPVHATRAVNNFYYNHPRAWGAYGFKTALNLDVEPAWYAEEDLALDKGIAVMAIENNRSGLVWRMFMRNTHVLNGLAKLGVRYATDTTPLEVAIAEARIAHDRAVSAKGGGDAGVGRLRAAITAAEGALVDAGSPDGVRSAATDLRAAMEPL